MYYIAVSKRYAWFMYLQHSALNKLVIVQKEDYDFTSNVRTIPLSY